MSSQLFGYQAQAAGENYGWGNVLYGSGPFSVSAPGGTFDWFKAYTDPSYGGTTLLLGLYADKGNGKAPNGAPIVQTALITMPGSGSVGWKQYSPTVGGVLVPAGNYWFSWWIGGTWPPLWNDGPSVTPYMWIGSSYSGLTSLPTLSGASDASAHYVHSIYGSVTPSGRPSSRQLLARVPFCGLAN